MQRHERTRLHRNKINQIGILKGRLDFSDEDVDSQDPESFKDIGAVKTNSTNGESNQSLESDNSDGESQSIIPNSEISEEGTDDESELKSPTAETSGVLKFVK